MSTNFPTTPDDNARTRVVAAETAATGQTIADTAAILANTDAMKKRMILLESRLPLPKKIRVANIVLGISTVLGGSSTNQNPIGIPWAQSYSISNESTVDVDVYGKQNATERIGKVSSGFWKTFIVELDESIDVRPRAANATGFVIIRAHNIAVPIASGAN